MKYTPVSYEVLDNLHGEAFDRLNWPPEMLVVDVLYIDPDPDSMEMECVDGPLGNLIASNQYLQDAKDALEKAWLQAEIGAISIVEYKQAISRWEAIAKKVKGSLIN